MVTYVMNVVASAPPIGILIDDITQGGEQFLPTRNQSQIITLASQFLRQGRPHSAGGADDQSTEPRFKWCGRRKIRLFYRHRPSDIRYLPYNYSCKANIILLCICPKRMGI